MPGARWFPGTRLNYVDQVLRHEKLPGLALIAESEPGGPTAGSLSWAELRRQVAAVAHTLRGLGVKKGDRIVGYLPDVPQAIGSFLATASIGVGQRLSMTEPEGPSKARAQRIAVAGELPQSTPLQPPGPQGQ
ncbi:AMP-binding protein [Paraburkholderia unamae]|uniref:AMP-binding protein n=2 Tax=Paraburkholderia TaxID=1822464 RepID=A0ACC6RTS0_9BURK